MITFNELQYVNSWGSKCPYPGKDYAIQSTDKLISSYNDYLTYYNNKLYSIILSNGEQFDLRIQSKNLCHMLGIDYKNLMSEYFDNFRKEILGIEGTIKSFELLKIIIENINNVIDFDEKNKGKILNYYRIMVKNNIFEKLSDFSRFNFSVINYDKTKSLLTSSFNSSKFLYVQSNEIIAPYFMMGILKNKETSAEEVNENEYLVETLFSPDDPKNFFNNQEVVIPIQIQINDGDTLTKKEATANEKLALLNQYKLLVSTYSIKNKLNIMGDYESKLADEVSKKLIK